MITNVGIFVKIYEKIKFKVFLTDLRILQM